MTANDNKKHVRWDEMCGLVSELYGPEHVRKWRRDALRSCFDRYGLPDFDGPINSAYFKLRAIWADRILALAERNAAVEKKQEQIRSVK